MRRRESCDRHSERAAAYVVQPHLVAELYALGVAAVFAADAAFEVGLGLASQLDGHSHELAYAADIEGLERVAFEDFLFDVLGQEAAGVVAAVAEGHLRQVVGAEA